MLPDLFVVNDAYDGAVSLRCLSYASALIHAAQKRRSDRGAVSAKGWRSCLGGELVSSLKEPTALTRRRKALGW